MSSSGCVGAIGFAGTGALGDPAVVVDGGDRPVGYWQSSRRNFADNSGPGLGARLHAGDHPLRGHDGRQGVAVPQTEDTQRPEAFRRTPGPLAADPDPLSHHGPRSSSEVTEAPKNRFRSNTTSTSLDTNRA